MRLSISPFMHVMWFFMFFITYAVCIQSCILSLSYPLKLQGLGKLIFYRHIAHVTQKVRVAAIRGPQLECPVTAKMTLKFQVTLSHSHIYCKLVVTPEI